MTADDRRTTDHHGHDVIDPLYVGIVTVSTSRAKAAMEHRTSDETDDDGEPGTGTGTSASGLTPADEHIEDPGGDTIQSCFEAEGHEIKDRVLVRDDFASIRTAVRALVARRDIDIVVTTGGTGVTADDVSPDATSSLFERELPGFGELFRSLSWEEVGTRAMASRATAGIAADTPVFTLPGSKNACRTACEKLIVPESPHLAGLATAHRVDATEPSLTEF